MDDPNLTRRHDPVWLCQRLDDLERAHRRLKRAVTAGLLGLAALGVLGQAVPRSKVVEAERFIVRDPAGKTRASLGSAGLSFHDSAGKMRVGLDSTDG